MDPDIYRTLTPKIAIGMVHTMTQIPSSSAQAEVRKVLKPIIAIFAGQDKGRSLAKLQHGYLDELYNKTELTPQELELVDTVKRFSRLCEIVHKQAATQHPIAHNDWTEP